MWVRKCKGVEEYLENNFYYVILNLEEVKGCWYEIFGNNNFIYIEVGFGKGVFIIGMVE